MIDFTSVGHPQINGAIEGVNVIIFTGISKKLFDVPKGKWVEELTLVIRAHNISETRATKFTPFRLYGKAVITPKEAGAIRIPSHHNLTKSS